MTDAVVEPQAGEPTGSEPPWTRLHPVTVIRELLGLAWNFVGAIVISGFGPDMDAGPLGSLELLLPAAVVALGFVRYLFTSYAVTDDAVLYRRGIVVRQRTVLPRARIQNVAIGADVVARLFSMQTLTISSAGSEGEVELAVVSKDTARALLAELTAPQPSVAPDLSPPIGPPVPGAHPSDGSGGLESGAGLDVVDPPAPTGERVERYRLTTKNHLLYAFTSKTVVVGVVSVVIAIAMMVFFESTVPLVWMVGLVVPIVTVLDLFGFVFEVEPRRVRVSHGLFSTQEKWAQKRRIQLVEVRRPWIRHRLGRETLAVATADVTESSGGRFDLCAPLISHNTWHTFLSDLIDPVPDDAGSIGGELTEEASVDGAPDGAGLTSAQLDESMLQRVARVSIRRRAIRSFLGGLVPIAGLVAGAVAIEQRMDAPPVDVRWWWPLALVPLVLVGSILLARKSWGIDGWMRRGPWLVVRRGRFDTTLRLVLVSKVQGVFLRRSIFQRRLGLASVRVDTANLGATTLIPDLPLEEAAALAEELAAAADRIWLPDGV